MSSWSFSGNALTAVPPLSTWRVIFVKRANVVWLANAGTFSLGDRVRYEQFEGNKLPEDFSVENSLDESFARAEGGWAANCPSGGGWTVEGEELRYRWTPCVSTLSLSLHLTRPGFAEFQYQLSKEGTRGLVQMLQVRNAQCQSYGWANGWIY